MRQYLPFLLLFCALLTAGCCLATPTPGSSGGDSRTPSETISVEATTPTTDGTGSAEITPVAGSTLATPVPTDTPGGTTPGGAGTLRVSILDVGQGDSILIQSPGGKTMLLDAGDSDAGDRVAATLSARGISSLDAAAISHAHADHIGGYQTVLARFPVGRFYDPGYPHTSSTYEKLLTTIDQRNLRYSTLTAGQTINLDPSIRIDVLSPDGRNTGDLNDNMLVLRLRYGSVSFLFAGDMEEPLEQRIASSLQPTTVLKVAHHGSRTSSSHAFLATVKPQVAVISLSAGNSYNHPHAAVVQRLLSADTSIYRTDQSGTVTISTDGTTYTVTTDRSGWSAPGQVPLPTATTQRPVSASRTEGPVATSGGAVAITALDLKGETLTITNSGSSPASLAGWKLTDEGAKHTYTFARTTLPAGTSVTVASGNATGDIKWKGDNVWNNNGDTAYLYNAAGTLVSSRKG